MLRRTDSTELVFRAASNIVLSDNETLERIRALVIRERAEIPLTGGKAPQFYLARLGKTESLSFVLALRCDPEIRGPDEMNLLDTAILSGQEKTADMIYKKIRKDCAGLTPVEWVLKVYAMMDESRARLGHSEPDGIDCTEIEIFLSHRLSEDMAQIRDDLRYAIEYQDKERTAHILEYLLTLHKDRPAEDLFYLLHTWADATDCEIFRGTLCAIMRDYFLHEGEEYGPEFQARVDSIRQKYQPPPPNTGMPAPSTPEF